MRKNIKVGVREIKIVDIPRQEVSKKMALKIEVFACGNSYERTIDYKNGNSQHVRFERDRRSANSPFIFIDKEEGVYTIGGRIRGLHAEYFLEEFCCE